MTDKEKVNRLAAYLLDGCDMNMLTYEEVKDTLSEIVEWKDCQFKESKAINEEELDNLAQNFTPFELMGHYNVNISKEIITLLKDCFKAGYRKAKEE